MEEIECPSGLAGCITYVSAETARHLTNARELRSGKTVDRILEACWKDTTQWGPYAFNGAVEWERVLACDKTYALLMIRVVTFGESYELELHCPTCGHKFIWDVPLRDLPVRPLSEEARSAFRAGSNSFETVLRDGRKVWFKLMTGFDQLRAIKSIRDKADDLVTAAIRTRVLDIEGVERKDLDKAIAQLSMGDVQHLMQSFDTLDGGVETLIEVYCPVCHGEWELDLPLDLQAMFAPSKRKSRLPHVKKNQLPNAS